LARKRSKHWRSPLDALTGSSFAGLTFLGLAKLSADHGGAVAQTFEIGVLSLAAGGALVLGRRIWRWRQKRRWLDGVEMARIDEMPGVEFERACADIFRRLGYKVKTTKTTGDQGADLLLEGKYGRAVVQTKRQKSKVGNEAVQQVVAAKAFYAANDAFVVTNHFYSPAAMRLAEANGVRLLDRRDLAKMLAHVARRNARWPWRGRQSGETVRF
jgi:restriction system protein